MHHGAALAEESRQPALVEAVTSGEWHDLSERIRLPCGYALRLTLRPWEMEESDVSLLRTEGFSDRDIVDANQVVSYFNYVNRVADGLGVDLEARGPDTVGGARHIVCVNAFSRAGDPSEPGSDVAPASVAPREKIAVQRERPDDGVPLGEGVDTVVSPMGLATSNEPALPTDPKVGRAATPQAGLSAGEREPLGNVRAVRLSRLWGHWLQSLVRHVGGIHHVSTWPRLP